MRTLDTLVGLDHALVKLRLRDALHQREEHRALYLDDVVLPRDGRRIRDLVALALEETKEAA